MGPPLETELKLRIPPDRLEALLASPLLAGEETAARLRSTYFDTADRAVRKGGFALRVRETGEGFLQTLKAENGASVFSRGEWERPVDGPGLDPAALAETPLAAWPESQVAALRPLFATLIERRTRRVQWAGATIEAAFDQGEIVAGDRRQPIAELELELKAGDPAALFDLARRLAAEWSAVLSLDAKGERGHRLADGEDRAPRTASTRPLETALSAADGFRKVAHGCLSQVVANAELLLMVERPEAVHQLRVGLRRLRAALIAFGPILAGPRRDGVEAELKWLAGELDAARDLDVLIKDLFRPGARALDDPGLAPLGRRLLHAQTLAYGRALGALRSQRYAQMLVETAAFIERGDWMRTEEPATAALRDGPVKALADAALADLLGTVLKRARGFNRLDPAKRHKLRIRAKRLRYAAEFFAALYAEGDAQDAFAKTLERMQDRLGALNDLAFARSELLALADIAEPELAYAAGRLVGRLEPAEPAMLGKARKAVKRLKRAEPFWAGG